MGQENLFKRFRQMEMDNILTTFAGYECVRVNSGALSLWITTSIGPRIIGLTIGHSQNLLAVVPEATTVTPSGKRYHFRGGHRLWHGPEDPEKTYVPDDGPVKVMTNHPDGLTSRSSAISSHTGGAN